uniref:C-type lectin domain-containing protein n=1 Tax=Oryzias sinensis TaxID=183150 RepID=A0A8C8DPS0_9TELE
SFFSRLSAWGCLQRLQQDGEARLHGARSRSCTQFGCKARFHLQHNRLLVEQKQKLQGFFCLNLIVVQEEKTWEEALEHCRENHGDLTSLLSETENRLAQREIQNSTITQRVWVGLRFLGDTWKWVNGDPLEFQAWNQTGDPEQQSPVWRRCGALTKQGEWENRDCQEKLNFICFAELFIPNKTSQKI